MSDIVYIVIIAELLFICGLCGYFIVKLRQRLASLAKRLNPGAASGKSGPADPSIAAYMQNQLKLTRQLPETELGKELDLSPLVTMIRCAYLSAERRALKQPEGSKAYWQTLRDELNKLLGVLSTEAKRAGSENLQLKERIRLMQERLEKLGDSQWVADNTGHSQSEDTPGYVLRFSRGVDTSHQSAQKASRHGLALFDRMAQQKRHVGRLSELVKQDKDSTALEQKVTQYERLLYKMEHESAQLQKDLNDARKRLAHVDQAFNAPQPTPEQTKTLLSVIRASRENADKDPSSFEDLLSDGQALGVQSRKNLDSLQKTIFEQRKSILAMESTIARLESELSGNQEGNESKRQELDKLKRALMESETCIQVLEGEVDNLHNHLEQLQHQREELKTHYKDVDDEHLLAALEEGREQKQLETAVEAVVNSGIDTSFLTEFMSNAIESGSLEDLITVLQHAVTELGFKSLIRLQVGTNKVDISSLGSLPKEDKGLIERLELNPTEPIQLRNQRVTLHFKNARAILHPTQKGNALNDSQRQYLNALFGFSSNLADKVAAQKQKSQRLDEYEYFNEMLHTINTNLEAQYRYQREETQAIIQSIVDQSHMLVGEKPTAGQKTVLEAMTQEAIQRAELLDANRAIVRKQFQKLIEKLDNLA